MAILTERLPENVPGRYYVDVSCIDCDQCRVEAPEFFARNEDTGFSFVQRQPTKPEEVELMDGIMAACATNSIGNDGC